MGRRGWEGEGGKERRGWEGEGGKTRAGCRPVLVFIGILLERPVRAFPFPPAHPFISSFLLSTSSSNEDSRQ